jgi:hypothetical protein
LIRLDYVRHLSYAHPIVPLNYMQMLLDLMEERQKWLNQRDEAVREISRLTELIRATMNMVPPEQIARYEPVFERLENRPLGLSMAIRACFTEGMSAATMAAKMYRAETGSAEKSEGGVTGPHGHKAEEGRRETSGIPSGITGSEIKDKSWLTPVEIRDALKRMGFPFENYKANPLASIHTTLKRMVPAEMEVKTRKDGQKVYRLKSAGQWAAALAEARQWLSGNFQVHRTAGGVVAVKRRAKDEAEGPGADKADKNDGPQEGKKRGTAGSA